MKWETKSMERKTNWEVKNQELIDPEIFKKEFLCNLVVDEEYEIYRKLWDEYRMRTNGMGRSMSKECFNIHKQLFGNLPRNDKYQRAKIDSLRETPI